MENERSCEAFKGAIVTILLLLFVCAGICTYKYVKGEIPYITQDDSSIDEVNSDTVEIPTVDEAMKEWQEIKEYNRCCEIYFEFPPEIMRALFEKLGTQELIRNYVYEYELNREYYISLQIAEQLKRNGLENPGIDGKRIENVEIKTKLKEEEKKPNIIIPATAGDSVI